MQSPIETNALRLIVELFERPPGENSYLEGSDIQERTGLSPQDINDAVNYLNSKGLIEQLSFLGTTPYDFGGVKINVHGKQYYYDTKKLKSKRKSPVRNNSPKASSIKIFISHSSKDAGVAKKVIDLLRASLNLTDEDIRCTSVNGYRLKGGADTTSNLRAEVFSCELLIGLISANSMQSHYTLFELGARWGADKHMLPLIIDAKGTEILGGPLQGINALDAHDVGQVLQFVSDAGGYINKTAGKPSAYLSHIQDLIASLSSTQMLNSQEVNAKEGNREELNNKSSSTAEIDYSDADEIIRKSCEKEYPDDFAMQDYCIDKQQRALKILHKGRPSDIPEKQFEIIRKNAFREYPDDFSMQAYAEEKQFNAWRKLRNK
jgi:hypothetical protein